MGNAKRRRKHCRNWSLTTWDFKINMKPWKLNLSRMLRNKGLSSIKWRSRTKLKLQLNKIMFSSQRESILTNFGIKISLWKVNQLWLKAFNLLKKILKFHTLNYFNLMSKWFQLLVIQPSHPSLLLQLQGLRFLCTSNSLQVRALVTQFVEKRIGNSGPKTSKIMESNKKVLPTPEFLMPLLSSWLQLSEPMEWTPAQPGPALKVGETTLRMKKRTSNSETTP